MVNGINNVLNSLNHGTTYISPHLQFCCPNRTSTSAAAAHTRSHSYLLKEYTIVFQSRTSVMIPSSRCDSSVLLTVVLKTIQDEIDRFVHLDALGFTNHRWGDADATTSIPALHQCVSVVNAQLRCILDPQTSGELRGLLLDG